MPEYARVPLTDETVLLAPSRSGRPGSTGTAACPFCPGNEGETLPEVAALRDRGEANAPTWRVRAVPNKYPTVAMPDGEHEVIVDDREHAVIISSESLLMYRDRFAHYEAHPWANAIVLFKNVGVQAGATIEHPHAQLVALAQPPARLRRMWANAWAWHREHQRCFWCEALTQKPVYENDSFALRVPAVPRFDGELLLLPRKHEASFGSLTREDADAFVDAFGVAQHRLGDHYNMLFYSAMRAAGQPAVHWHVSLVPREHRRLGGFELSSGMWIVEDEESGPRSVM